MKGPRRGVVGPLWRAATATKGGGVVVRLLMQGTISPCRCVWQGVGPSGKFTKIIGQWDLKLKLGDNLI